jgi:hypothetical protein
MICLHLLRSLSVALLPISLIACGDSTGPGGSNQGGQGGDPNVGGNQLGGANAGGDNAGGDNAGGDSAGGDNAGGDSAGGDSAGGDNAGGGASFQDCVDASEELAEIYELCDIDERKPDCEGADYDNVVCIAACGEGQPCEALNGEDPEAAFPVAQCLEACR